MTINEEIKKEMHIFLMKEIQNLIDTEDFETLYKIETIKYGDYDIKINYEQNISFSFAGVSFYFPKYTKKYHHKTFLTIKYGAEIETKHITELGKLEELYYEGQKKYHEIRDNKNIINALPDNVKNSILRKRKLEVIISDDLIEFPEDELRKGL